MVIPDVPLPVRREAQHLMIRIETAAKIVNRHFRALKIDDETFLKMTELEILMEKARVLLETLKPQPVKEKEDYAQAMLHFALTVDAQEKSTVADDNPEVVLDLDPAEVSTNGMEF